jgi:hypothetical protein
VNSMRGAGLTGGAGAGFLIILVVGLAMFGMITGLIVLTPPKDNGARPAVHLFQNEVLVPVTRMSIRGTGYALWDVRDNATHLLKYMILVNPATGAPIVDQNVQSTAFAIRLALQMAYVVRTIANSAQSAQDAAGQLAGLGTVAVYAARAAGEGSLANKMEDFGIQMQEKTGPALALATTLGSDKGAADKLANDPTDQNADMFLINFGATTAETAAAGSSQRAAFTCSIITTALQDSSIPINSWLVQIYDFISVGSNPGLSLISATFGAYEASQTTSALNARGVY